MKIIKVLLLDDMENDFLKIKEIIEQIGKDDFENRDLQLELLYDWNDTHSLVSNFVASKTMEAHLQEPFKKIVLEKVEQIKKEKMLICLLDIVWTKEPKKKKNGGKIADTYGCDFYCDYLNDANRSQNTILVTAISKIPNTMKNIEKVDKFKNKIPLGDDFKKELKDKIYKLPIITNNIAGNENEDRINPHTKK